MKLINLNTNVVFALVVAAVIAISVPAKADEAGFTLEDSIRHQIFMELRANVQNLYHSGNLVVPGIDTSFASRVASNNSGSGYTLPINVNANETKEHKTVNNIN